MSLEDSGLNSPGLEKKVAFSDERMLDATFFNDQFKP